MTHVIVPNEEIGPWETGDSSWDTSEPEFRLPQPFVSDGPTGQMLLEMRREEKPFLFPH